MLCPICGKELPDKARKCDKCGCRPKYLYGRPKRPKWVIPMALALAVAILAGCLLFLQPPEEAEKFYEISLLRSSRDGVTETRLSYDDNGNLEEVIYGGAHYSSSMSSFLIPSIRVQFFYDENGVLTEVREFSGTQLSRVGKVEYYEEDNSVIVWFQEEENREEDFIKFRYGQDGRMEEYYTGVSYKTTLYYDEAGVLQSTVLLEAVEGEYWERYRTYTLEYDAEGMVTGLNLNFSSSGIAGYHSDCERDQWGNVLKLTGWMNKRYSYSDRQIVTGQTARQYTLQMYLLDAMGVPGMAMFPVMKTPSEKGDSQ